MTSTGNDNTADTRIDLRTFLLGPELILPPGTHADWLHRAVPDSAFYLPSGSTPEDRLSLHYARSRHAARTAPSARDLIDDPRLLAALMARLVVADPVMFHICMVHYTLVLAPILESDPTDSSQYLRDARSALESMASFGAALMSESSHRSSSHLHLRTQATFDPATGEFVLHTPDADAAKFPNHTGSPTVSKTAAVYAQLVVAGRERGMFVFVVVLRGPDGTPQPGIEIIAGPDTTALATDNAYVRFDQLRIPFGAWLANGAELTPDGVFHDPQRTPTARRTRTMGTGAPLVWSSVIAASASVTQAAARILQSHTAMHMTIGRGADPQPLISLRPVQEAVLDALGAAYALSVVANHATVQRDEHVDSAADNPDAFTPWSMVDRELPLLKAASTRICAAVVTNCRSGCGASGFAAYNRLNAFLGWAHAYCAAGGDNNLILMDTARAMTDSDSYRPPDADSGTEYTTDPDSPRACLDLIRAAERQLHRQLTTSIETAHTAGCDESTAWDDNLTLGRLAAAVYADRIVLELLCDAHDTAPVPVGKLLHLYALSSLENRAALVADLPSTPPGLLGRIWKQRRLLHEDLRHQIAHLAAVFDFPDLRR